jgi:hypothetical protein
MAKIPKRRGGGQRMPKNLAQFDKLPRRSQVALENAAHVVTRMREGASLKSAAAEYGIAPKTVLRLAGPALRKTERGHYAAKRSDRLFRPLVVPAHGGRIEVGVIGSRKSTALSDRLRAQGTFIATGDASGLRALETMTILDADGREIPFLTDPEELERQGDLGISSFESIYAKRS